MADYKLNDKQNACSEKTMMLLAFVSLKLFLQ